MAKQSKRGGMRRHGRPGAVAAIEYDSQASVGYQLRKTSLAMASLLKAQIASENISIGIWYFLRALWVRDGLIQRELTEHVGLMQPTTVAALHSMQKKGLVRTEPDKTDRRSIRIFLTRQGRQLKAKLLPKVAELNKVALRGVNRDDRELFLRVLKKIHENAAAVSSSRSS